MTKLVVDELKTELEEEFTIEKGRIVKLKSIRPYLYCHNSPSGTFTLQILKDAEVLGSGSFTSNDLYTSLGATNDFIRLFYRIEFDSVLPLKNGVYKLKLISSGYTFSESSYLGWIREHEDIKTLNDGTAENYLSNPLTFEVWEYD